MVFSNHSPLKMHVCHTKGGPTLALALGRPNEKGDGKLRHPADAAQWGNIDSHYHWFAHDCRNIRFAMSTDGVKPFGNQSSTHSTWPVILSVLNLPPWLCKKRKYLMLSILVSGPKQPGDRIDVYLRPLVDDLKILRYNFGDLRYNLLFFYRFD